MSTNASNLWDLSGKSQNPSLPAGTRTTGTTGTSTESSTQTKTESGSRSFSSQNTPQFALNAMEALITQLSDRPAVSDAELMKQAPDLQTVYSPQGWYYQDPATGMTYNITDPAAMKLKQERAAKREQLKSQAGVVSGGTVETKQANAERQTEIGRSRTMQAGYSKDAAFADATALTGRFTRQLMEQLMPQINKAVESSGTSGGAVRGLLAQDAAARVGEAQAALGLNAAVQYGAINNQLESTLELLTRANNPTTQALLQALGMAKGTINSGSEATRNTTTVDTDTTKNTVQNELLNQTGAKPAAGGGTSVAAPVPLQPSGPSYMEITVGNQAGKTGGTDAALSSLLAEVYGSEYGSVEKRFQF